MARQISLQAYAAISGDDLVLCLCREQCGGINTYCILTVLDDRYRQLLFNRTLSKERKRGNILLLTDQQKIPDHGTHYPPVPQWPQDIQQCTLLLLYQPRSSTPTYMHE